MRSEMSTKKTHSPVTNFFSGPYRLIDFVIIIGVQKFLRPKLGCLDALSSSSKTADT